MDTQLRQRQKTERVYLLDIIRCLRYLDRQGIPLQGHDNKDNFTQLLYLLGTKDKNVEDHVEEKIGHKYNHEIQNEISTMMSNQVLRNEISTIHGRQRN